MQIRNRRKKSSGIKGRPTRWGEPTRRVSIRLPISVADRITSEKIIQLAMADVIGGGNV